MSEEWVTIPQAARLIERTTWAVYKWLQRGKIKGYETDTGSIIIFAPELLAAEAKTSRKGGRPYGSASRNGPRVR